MGKYLRKTRVASDVVAVVELPQSAASGVCTRARTSSKAHSSSPSSSPLCYLELRNRRLQRQPCFSVASKQKPSKIHRNSGAIDKPDKEAPQEDNCDTFDKEPKELIRKNEIEEFLTLAEQEQQRLFTEKYNFDVVNEVPLPGRYEWVRVLP